MQKKGIEEAKEERKSTQNVATSMQARAKRGAPHPEACSSDTQDPGARSQEPGARIQDSGYRTRCPDKMGQLL